jgi:hypothetical protein
MCQKYYILRKYHRYSTILCQKFIMLTPTHSIVEYATSRWYYYRRILSEIQKIEHDQS